MGGNQIRWVSVSVDDIGSWTDNQDADSCRNTKSGRCVHQDIQQVKEREHGGSIEHPRVSVPTEAFWLSTLITALYFPPLAFRFLTISQLIQRYKPAPKPSLVRLYAVA